MIIWSYIYHDKHDNDTLPGDIAVYMQHPQFFIKTNKITRVI